MYYMKGVYKLTNKINGKIYIGKSINIPLRLAGHRTDFRGRAAIKRAIKKYKWENFDVEILFDDQTVDNYALLALESAFIDYFQATDQKVGYNLCLFATDKSGIPMSKRQKNLLSKQRKGKYLGENNPFWGKTHNNTTKEKMRQCRIGKKASKQTKEKMSKTRLGKPSGNDCNGQNNPMFGKNHSKSTKEKLKLLKLNKPVNKKILKFFNILTNEIFEGTQLGFIRKYNLNSGNVSLLIDKKSKSVKKWILL